LGEFKESQYLCGPFAVLVSNDGNASGLAAGITLDPDRLKFSPDAVRQADREGIATHNNRPAVFDKQASPFLTTRHQRPLTLIENEYRQTSSPKTTPSWVTLPAGNLPSAMLQRSDLRKTRFGPIPGCLKSGLREVRNRGSIRTSVLNLSAT
jgi:hypothetical protein